MFPKFNQRQIHHFEAPRTIENQVWQTKHSLRPVSSFESNQLHIEGSNSFWHIYSGDDLTVQIPTAND